MFGSRLMQKKGHANGKWLRVALCDPVASLSVRKTIPWLAFHRFGMDFRYILLLRAVLLQIHNQRLAASIKRPKENFKPKFQEKGQSWESLRNTAQVSLRILARLQRELHLFGFYIQWWRRWRGCLHCKRNASCSPALSAIWVINLIQRLIG